MSNDEKRLPRRTKKFIKNKFGVGSKYEQTVIQISIKRSRKVEQRANFNKHARRNTH